MTFSTRGSIPATCALAMHTIVARITAHAARNMPKHPIRIRLTGMYFGHVNERCSMSQEKACKAGNHDLYEEYRYNNGQFIVIVLACRYCDYKTTQQERRQ